MQTQIAAAFTQFFREIEQREESFKAEIARCRQLLSDIQSGGDIDYTRIELELKVLRELSNMYKISANASVAIERLDLARKTGNMLTISELENSIQQIAMVGLLYVPHEKQMAFLSELQQIGVKD